MTKNRTFSPAASPMMNAIRVAETRWNKTMGREQTREKLSKKRGGCRDNDDK